MSKKIVCTVLFMMFACVNATAQEGFFFSGGLGKANIDGDFDGFNDSDDSTAYRLSAGWKFNDHFAIEAGYQDFGDFEYRRDAANQPDNSGQLISRAKLSADGFTTGAVGILPLNDKFSLYGRAGMYFWDGNAEINDVSQANPEDTNPYFGIGLSYAISERVFLTGDWTHFDLESADGDMLAVGIQVFFGR